MSEYRIEKDSLGEVRVPANSLYGAQTQRAIDNFPVSGKPMPRRFIEALLLVKACAARAACRSAALPSATIRPAATSAIAETSWTRGQALLPD